MKQMIHISGADKLTLREATSSIISIIKAGGTEAVAVAGVSALVALAKAPDSVSMSGCSFDARTVAGAKRGKS